MIYGDPLILGGGGGDVFAFIVATYPVGSVCTASSGSTTLTAGDTSGSWVFKIPAAGSWTVTSTDGTNTASATVSISTEGQSESVELSYWNGQIYMEGNKYESVTGGFTTVNVLKSSHPSAAIGTFTDGTTTMTISTTGTNYQNIGVSTVNKIDLTDYSTITVNLTSNNYTASRFAILVTSNNQNIEMATNLNVEKRAYFDANATTGTMDISDLSGEYYVVLGAFNTTGTHTAVISQWFMS